MTTQNKIEDRPFLLDPTLAEKLFGSQTKLNRQQGHYELLYALLEDAIRCFQRRSELRGWRAKRLADEAEEWFFSDEYHWPFSFLNVCAVLDLDPGYIRAGLRRWSRQYPGGLPLQRRKSQRGQRSFHQAA
jgi:hypothetical protein